MGNLQMKELDKLQLAIDKNEFAEYLKGTGIYKEMSRDTVLTDAATVLYIIYDYYAQKPESKINLIFESTLLSLLNGNEFDIMTSFDYCLRQYLREQRGTAPFLFNCQTYEKVKETIENNADLLKNYKDFYEYGNTLNDGAYEYAHNAGAFMDPYDQKVL